MGKLTREDYDRFVPAFERIARGIGPVRMLIQLQDFQGWDLPALWEDLKFDTSHQSDLGRVAILGEKTWQAWGTRLSKPFFKAEMRFFPLSEEDAARRWLTSAAR